jgi:hypothetical protein
VLPSAPLSITRRLEPRGGSSIRGRLGLDFFRAEPMARTYAFNLELFFIDYGTRRILSSMRTLELRTPISGTALLCLHAWLNHGQGRGLNSPVHHFSSQDYASYPHYILTHLFSFFHLAIGFLFKIHARACFINALTSNRHIFTLLLIRCYVGDYFSFYLLFLIPTFCYVYRTIKFVFVWSLVSHF